MLAILKFENIVGNASLRHKASRDFARSRFAMTISANYSRETISPVAQIFVQVGSRTMERNLRKGEVIYLNYPDQNNTKYFALM